VSHPLSLWTHCFHISNPKKSEVAESKPIYCADHIKRTVRTPGRVLVVQQATRSGCFCAATARCLCLSQSHLLSALYSIISQFELQAGQLIDSMNSTIRCLSGCLGQECGDGAANFGGGLGWLLHCRATCIQNGTKCNESMPNIKNV